jgi:phosphatidylglycerol lysyltransferase
MSWASFETLGRRLFKGLPLVLLAVAAWILWRELSVLRPQQIAAEVAAWGPWRIAGAALATAVSFALLAATEWLGLRWAGAKVPFARVLVGAFCANAIGHVVGFSVVVGGVVRARLYKEHGSVAAAAQASLYVSLSFAFGIALFAGLALLLHPVLPGLHSAAAFALGLGLIAATAAYLIACAVVRKPLRIRGHAVALPPPGAAVAQVVLGFADNLVTAAVVWLLLGGVAFPAFAGAYALATVAGVVSSVPGGAGVFEGVVLGLLPQVSRAPLIAALLGYRLIYYIAPLLIAAGIIVAITPLRRTFAIGWRRAAPALLAAGAFGVGALLILTGIGRIDPLRLQILQANVPALALETSHLLSIVCGFTLMGACLLLLRRHASAVPFAAGAAVAGASTALLRGLDIGPALAALALGVVIVASRRAFIRRGAWRLETMLPWWLAASALVLVGAVALGLWVYDDTPYEAALWAHIGYHADPSRFLRSAAIMGGLLLATGVWALARTAAPYAKLAAPQTLERLRPLVEAEPDTTARLALTGDKAVLTAPDESAFIAYGAEGRSYIAMGDPVGAREAGKALLWRFKEMADRAAARPVFYHASPRWMIDYLDIGLSLLKLGEEARVPLAEFSLDGSRRAKLRQSRARAERDGLSFEIALPPHAGERMAELRAISDAWLMSHGGAEKGFSLGRFDPAALAREPLALVRAQGRIVAFANVWTGGREEASIDLMRHPPDAPNGVMDFLFVELMLWAKDQGFAWFNLGMAPLSGLAEHRLAPLWHKIGAQIARRGGRYYGFTGLRAFKAKFDPVWTPRYLAAPPADMAAALLDVTRLIARPPPDLPADRQP